VEPFGVAVIVIMVPLGKVALHAAEHPRPEGELAMVPAPLPPKSTVRVTPEPPEPPPVKQTTLAVK